MKKLLKLFGIAVAIGLCFVDNAPVIYARGICNASGNCFTRTTNPPTNDIWAVGGLWDGYRVVTYSEIVLDYTGSLYPTSTLGAQTLGTATFPWLEGYFGANGISDTGALTVTGAITGSAAVTAGALGTNTVSGKSNATLPATVTSVGGFSSTECSPYTSGQTNGLNVSSTVVVACGFETIISSGSGSVVITGTPSISTTVIGGLPIPSGFILVLTSTAAAGAVFQDQGTLSGSLLALGAGTRTVTKTKTLTVIWESLLGRWSEIAYGNNQGN